MQTFNETLRDLLNRCDAVAEMYPEITASDVRVQMTRAVFDGFLHLSENYCLTPRPFAMPSQGGDTKVMAVLYAFISEAGDVAKREDLDTFQKRLAAFQNKTIVSDEGHDYHWYFDTWDAGGFDEDGKPIG
jgi:hypothetical protein